MELKMRVKRLTSNEKFTTSPTHDGLYTNIQTTLTLCWHNKPIKTLYVHFSEKIVINLKKPRDTKTQSRACTHSVFIRERHDCKHTVARTQTQQQLNKIAQEV